MSHQDDDRRARIATLLATGFETLTAPIPETSQEASRILATIQDLTPDNLEGRVHLAGLIDRPGPDENRCFECMYYSPHRRWCDLPELSLPVEAHWWCRLWRI